MTSRKPQIISPLLLGNRGEGELRKCQVLKIAMRGNKSALRRTTISQQEGT